MMMNTFLPINKTCKILIDNNINIVLKTYMQQNLFSAEIANSWISQIFV